MKNGDIWRALAEPLRRQLLEILRAGAQPAGQLALTTGHSQPLVSQHLRVLLEAGLVRVSPQGRSRLYGLNEEGFRTVAEWLAQYEVFWSERLDRLAEVVEQR
ncbi:MAG TPA: metalloregulator ArsR/SmtB family transcription factor [Fimbriimonadaceae bacterium]|nr:transcriptional regulator [Armatimonadota bacterium]HRD30706.1 metalloregulator ArsR/SmtB family transcription factor [Fimbriimonadaceae bacterium]HRE93177.1 metalloregulator ArsR/SmtB family transcription factor [Fimbriimonadaceae bacterium]